MDYHVNVLEPTEKGTIVLPVEPTAKKDEEGKISEEEIMKFKERNSRWCSQVEKLRHNKNRTISSTMDNAATT